MNANMNTKVINNLMPKLQIKLDNGYTTTLRNIYLENQRSFKMMQDISQALFNIFSENFDAVTDIAIREDLIEHIAPIIFGITYNNKVIPDIKVMTVKAGNINGGCIIWWSDELSKLQQEIKSPLVKIWEIIKNKIKNIFT